MAGFYEWALGISMLHVVHETVIPLSLLSILEEFFRDRFVGDFLGSEFHHIRFLRDSLVDLTIELLKRHCFKQLLVLLEVLHPGDGEEVAKASIQMSSIDLLVRIAVGTIRWTDSIGCGQGPDIDRCQIDVLEH